MTGEHSPGRTVVVRLNQQQLELVDRTVAELGATGRAEVLAGSLRAFHTLVTDTQEQS